MNDGPGEGQQQQEQSTSPWHDLGNWLVAASKVGIGVVGAAALLGGILGPGDEVFDSFVTAAALFFVLYAIVVSSVAVGRAIALLIAENKQWWTRTREWWNNARRDIATLIGTLVGLGVFAAFGLVALDPLSDAYETRFSCETPAITETGLNMPLGRAPADVTVWVGNPSSQSPELANAAIRWRIHVGAGVLQETEGDRVTYRATGAGSHVLEAVVTNECGRTAIVMIPVTVE